MPKCGAFTLFELTGAKRLVGTKHLVETPLGTSQYYTEDLSSYLSWTLGVMANRDSAHAVGGMVEVGLDGEGSRVAIKARRRTWDREGGSLDLTAGGIVVQEHAANGTDTPAFGVPADAAIAGSGLLLAGIAFIASGIGLHDF